MTVKMKRFKGSARAKGKHSRQQQDCKGHETTTRLPLSQSQRMPSASVRLVRFRLWLQQYARKGLVQSVIRFAGTAGEGSSLGAAATNEKEFLL